MKTNSQQEMLNIGLLEESGVAFGQLRPSRTALAKSILDSTVHFRYFLQTAGVHDFGPQPSGKENKRIVSAVLIDSTGSSSRSTASFNKTNRGDQRVWFPGLPAVVGPGDLLVCVWHSDVLWVCNGSNESVKLLLAQAELLDERGDGEVEADPSVLEDLLYRLRKISARGFIPAPVNGPTAIGRLLESELGIQMNSSKDPDFHGIEIKSARSGSRRATMFAQVPDWERSLYSGSGELLDAFGAEKPDGRALSCTISARKANPQGLFLQIDRDTDLLHVRENELDPHEVVLWQLETLRGRIATKHAETVWVEAAVQQVKNQEYLRFQAVHHTKDPRVEAFVPLLRSGLITVDFLIREDSDRGYLFKVVLDKLDSMFGYSKRYSLS